MVQYTTEYLILNEDTIDWERLSRDADDFFTLFEIRMFRKRINWKEYLLSHKSTISLKELEVASKHFTKEIYNEIAAYNIADEDFIVNHKDKFDFRIVIPNCNISEAALLECIDYWIHIPDIKGLFIKAKYIDINSKEFSGIKLLLKL